MARAEPARERARQRHREKLIGEITDIYLEVCDNGTDDFEAVVDVSKALMGIMNRAEQIEMLSGLLRRVPVRDRDDALELICALLVYAKPRRNAPRGEIAGVSMLNTVVKKSKGSSR